MTTHPPKTPDELAAALERARAKEAEKAAARKAAEKAEKAAKKAAARRKAATARRRDPGPEHDLLDLRRKAKKVFASLPDEPSELVKELRTRWEGVQADLVRAQIAKVVHEAFAGTALEEELAEWSASGKLARARFLDMIAVALGMPLQARVDLETAVELVHAGSLLHDDVIDESPERRGRPALWKTRGVKAALLAGDMLVASGLAACGSARVLDEIDAYWLTTELAFATYDTCLGELRQDFPLSGVEAGPRVGIAMFKTGALFSWAMEAGMLPLMPRLNNRQITFVRNMGTSLGIMFQRADDGDDLKPKITTTAEFKEALEKLSEEEFALLARMLGFDVDDSF